MKPVEFGSFPKTLAGLDHFGPYDGIVKAVHDGDTMTVLLDVGLMIYPFVTLRLAGINAPELHSAGGADALNYLLTLCPLGSPVSVNTRVQEKYGRWLAVVTACQPLGGLIDVNAAMVSSGHAVPYTVKVAG